MKRKLQIAAMALLLCSWCNASSVSLSLQDCRDYAVQQSKQSAIDKENYEAARDLKKATVAKFFPKVSANGGYMWVQNNLYLIPDNYSFPFGTMNADGTFVINDDAISIPLGDLTTINYGDIRTLFPDLDKQVSDWAAEQYTSLRNKSELDIHNVFVGQVGITQPIFLGGKIVEMYKMAEAYENIENIKLGKNNDELLVRVDEAYWRVISVEHKYELAKRYTDMLSKVESDIEAAVAEGTMTQADLLKVRVKLNEAQVSLAKAENGLQLSKMALCQIIGLPLDTDVHLDDSGLDNMSAADVTDPDMSTVLAQRKEIQMLEEADKMAHAAVKLTASGLMPNIVASANYVTTNPNLFNGYQNTFGGTFTAGVVVNIPIAHADDIYQLKAAKHKARTVELQLEEAKEMIQLQTTQSFQQLKEANRKLSVATANIDNAEENLRLAQAAFEEGMLTSTELLGAQTAWLKAYSEKIDAAIEVRMYEVYLRKNSGMLPAPKGE